MKTLDDIQCSHVGGAVDQATQIGFQGTLAGVGLSVLATGFTLSPFGAVVLIGTSLAVTASYLYDNL